MRKIAFVTEKDSPHLLDGELLLLDECKKNHLSPFEVAWDDPAVQWEQYDAVILRTCWNYHKHIQDFTEWVDRVEISGANLWNHSSIIKWNINKRYLFDLSEHGVAIVSSELIQKKSAVVSIENTIRKNGWNDVVIKPVFGSSAHNIFRFQARNISLIKSDLDLVLKDSEMILQPFIPEIVEYGEYSFIFFNKIYSHAVLKLPQRGDFRTQPSFGGTEHVVHPADQLVMQARKMLTGISDELLYARVDCVNIGGKLYLIELELTEPYLFFELNQEAPARFISALKNINHWV